MCLSIFVSFEELFISSLCMVCKALSNLKNSRITMSVFCGVSHVLTQMPLVKDKIFITGTPFNSSSIGISCLSLVAVLKYCSMTGGVLSSFKITFAPPSLSFIEFDSMNSIITIFHR